MRSRTVLTTALAGLALLAPLHAIAQAPADKWTFSVMPAVYLCPFAGAGLAESLSIGVARFSRGEVLAQAARR